MTFSTAYLNEVLRSASKRLCADLAAAAFTPPDIETSLEGRVFLIDMIKGDQRRFWRYAVDEPVYHYEPDGFDPETHGLWLATLLAEENTTMLHRE